LRAQRQKLRALRHLIRVRGVLVGRVHKDLISLCTRLETKCLHFVLSVTRASLSNCMRKPVEFLWKPRTTCVDRCETNSSLRTEPVAPQMKCRHGIRQHESLCRQGVRETTPNAYSIKRGGVFPLGQAALSRVIHFTSLFPPARHLLSLSLSLSLSLRPRKRAHGTPSPLYYTRPATDRSGGAAPGASGAPPRAEAPSAADGSEYTGRRSP
jgi:hypothetical protein